MEVKKPRLQEYFILPNSGLRAYLARTDRGFDKDVRTPFGNRRTREAVIKMWDKIFDGGTRSGAFKSEVFQSLLDYEREMRSKIGPLSYQAPLSHRLDGIKEYGAHVKDFSQVNYKQALSEMLSEFKSIHGIRLRNVHRVVEDLILSTNSGSPYFTKRKNVVMKSLQLGPENKRLCAVLGGRGQEGGPSFADVKQRTVFMMPLSLNIQEHRAYQPIIKAIQNSNLIPAYVSLRAVEERMTKLFDTKPKHDLIIATDFTKMDQHFNGLMQNIAEDALRGILHPSVASEEGLEEIFPIKYHIPLLLDERMILTGHHGMGSGSSGTNLDESLVHRTLQYYCAQSAGAKLNPYSQYLGDDGVLSYPGIKVEHVVEHYSKFGQVMNADKQYAATDNTIYLRRGYHKDYRDRDGICIGVYSTYRAIGRLLGQERYYDPKIGGPRAIILRAGSILENCANHPLFEKLVDFVVEGDKYKLGLSIPGFISKVESEYEKLKQTTSNGESYSRSLSDQGIKTGRIYKYLRSKL